jgi:predicted metal-dependent hydrolase
MKYLAGYPEHLTTQVQLLLDQGRLGNTLLARYRQAHPVRTDKALYDYVMGLKNEFLRNAEPLSKVAFDSKLQIIGHALGTHTTVSRVQGGKLKSKREIRVASLFKEVPVEFLRMIVVHELAHLKEKDHGKAFYQLCLHMEPLYHQYEFDLRVYLTHIDAVGRLAWPAGPA